MRRLTSKAISDSTKRHGVVVSLELLLGAGVVGVGGWVGVVGLDVVGAGVVGAAGVVGVVMASVLLSVIASISGRK